MIIWNLTWDWKEGSNEKTFQDARTSASDNWTLDHTTYGDVYDCVDMYKQPSLSHPLLKNHKIQVKPDETVQKLIDREISKPKQDFATELKLSENIGCPNGTVPIGRSKSNTLHTRQDLKKFFSSEGRGREREIKDEVYVRGTGLIFSGMQTKKDTVPTAYGAAARMSLWNPKVELDDEHSSAAIILESGEGPQRNYIHAGWTVNPKIYGDRYTRLYTVWTTDDLNKTGCFNVRCNGFIQTNHVAGLDHIFHTSESSGAIQETYIQILKDARGNWWLAVHIYVLGYWPGELFTSLGNGAKGVRWGGHVYVDEGDYTNPFPEMGTGYVWNEKYDESAFFEKMEFIDAEYKLVTPNSTYVDFLEDDYCYDTTNAGYSQEMGYNFMYGGPYIQGC